MSAFDLGMADESRSVWVIRANERINLGNTEALMNLATNAQDQGARRLLLDLSATPSITSSGLRAILSIFKQLGGAKAFKLVSPSPDVRRTLVIAGMAERIHIFDNLAAAVASFE